MKIKSLLGLPWCMPSWQSCRMYLLPRLLSNKAQLRLYSIPSGSPESQISTPLSLLRQVIKRLLRVGTRQPTFKKKGKKEVFYVYSLENCSNNSIETRDFSRKCKIMFDAARKRNRTGRLYHPDDARYLTQLVKNWFQLF